MDASLPLARDIDADDTVRVAAVTAEILRHALPDLPREPDLPGTSSLSFALLTELRSLTPTVQRSASQGPFVTRRSLRSYTALAATSWRRVLGVALGTWLVARAGTERAFVVARPHAAVWARFAQGVIQAVGAGARKHAAGARKHAAGLASRATAAAVLGASRATAAAVVGASRAVAVAVAGARHAGRVGARVHRLVVIHAVRTDAWTFKSSRAAGAARLQ